MRSARLLVCIVAITGGVAAGFVLVPRALHGLHALVLSAQGVEVYPRLEARVRAARAADPAGRHGKLDHNPADAEDAALAQPRAGFGLATLDRLLDGGLLRATSTVVAGDLGAGKTMLALQFALEGVRRDEPVVWLSFRESRAQLPAEGIAPRWGCAAGSARPRRRPDAAGSVPR